MRSNRSLIPSPSSLERPSTPLSKTSRMKSIVASRPSAHPRSEITLDEARAVQLGTLFSKPDASAVGMIMPVSFGGKTKKMVMGMIVIHVLQSRVLFIYTYAEYKDESSVQWIRNTDEHWADAILQANK